MAKYKLSGDVILDQETGASIPAVGGNRHFRAYLEWCQEGNTPDPEFTPEELSARELADIRAIRTPLLQESDHLVSADLWEDLTTKERQDIKAYRQALRDLPGEYSKLADVVWPVKPEKVKPAKVLVK